MCSARSSVNTNYCWPCCLPCNFFEKVCFRCHTISNTCCFRYKTKANMHFYPEIEKLIFNHLRGVSTSEEQKELNEWINSSPNNKRLFNKIRNRENIELKMRFFDRHPVENAWKGLHQRMSGKKRRFSWHWKIAASLAVPALIASSLLFLSGRDDQGKELARTEILPGSTCAQLELSDGRIISLNQDSLSPKKFALSRYLDNGSSPVRFGHTANVTTAWGYNELRTPRGGEYEIQLPDGTKVWLNAESTLRFPSTFDGNERRVSASGELYFEVAHNTDKPFYVELKDYTIKVTGTKFNIRAYDGEPQTTTLASGSVDIQSGKQLLHLTPGEEATCSPKAKENINVCKTDVESRLAWHRGYFLFDNARLEDIMTELGRWYNVEITFKEASSKEKRFSLELRRMESFVKVMKLIERAGMVEIDIKGNKILIK